MEYNKLTKAELIELLEQSISLEKYNRLKESYDVKKENEKEHDIVIKALKEQIQLEKNISEKKLKDVETQTNTYISQMQSQFQDLKSQIEYTSNVLNKEYQLTSLLLKKRKSDNEIFDELVNLYHETVFENKEEENKQESK